jgi:hypothetical protein
MNKPDWKNAPEWANWLAMDYGGEYYWFEVKPTLVLGLVWFRPDGDSRQQLATIYPALEPRPCDDAHLPLLWNHDAAEPIPAWNCPHQWVAIGPRIVYWTSESLDSQPPTTARVVQKKKCLLCQGVAVVDALRVDE